MLGGRKFSAVVHFSHGFNSCNHSVLPLVLGSIEVMYFKMVDTYIKIVIEKIVVVSVLRYT